MKQTYLSVFIIWSSLCMALLVYAGLLCTMTFDPKAAPSSTTGIFAVTAGISTMLSFVLRRVFLGGFHTGKLSLDTPEGVARYVMGHIVVFAFSESVGVLGLVNGLGGHGELDTWLPFIGGSLILMLIHIPLPSRFRPRSDGYQR